jgi:hypothetical protein
VSCSSEARNLITFWLAGTLGSDEADTVARHVAGCDECRAAAAEGAALIAGLRDLHLPADEIVAAAAGELTSPHVLVCSRCRDEIGLLRDVNADLARTTGAIAPARRWPLGLAAAAAVIVAVGAAWYFGSRQPALTPSAPTTAAVSPARTPIKITIEKASLTALATETVRLRGVPSPRRRMLDDLAVALEPYRRDDFAESAVRLRALREQYPDAPEMTYYLGVCLLLEDRPAEAMAPLEDAVRPRLTASAVPADEAAYYLAIARVNAGQPAAALPDLTRLCAAGSTVSPRACAAARQVPASR